MKDEMGENVAAMETRNAYKNFSRKA